MSTSEKPAFLADVAAPLLEECPEYLPSKSNCLIDVRRLDVTKSRVKAPPDWWKSEAFGDDENLLKKGFIDAIAHALSWVAATVNKTPRRKGSVFEAGSQIVILSV